MRLAAATPHHRGPILISLPANYLDMIADELLELPVRSRARLRIFTLSPSSGLPEGLRPYVLPYDHRFDGEDAPVPGTRSDFAQRALGHFVDAVLSKHPGGDFDGHAELVENLLAGFRPQRTQQRARLADQEISSIIHRHWKDAHGQSSRMLRLLRDDLGVACEQSRFRNLFRAAKNKRECAQ
jgi:hypothetical protein